MDQQTYKIHLRIKNELCQRCIEKYIKNWDDEIKETSEKSKNSKQIWSKIPILKGKIQLTLTT